MVPDGAGDILEAPQDHFLVLAGMHGGCHIYRLKFTVLKVLAEEGVQAASDWKFGISNVGSFHHTDERNDNHLAYGIDVLSHTATSDTCAAVEFNIASCSFYDNLVQFWTGVV